MVILRVIENIRNEARHRNGEGNQANKMGMTVELSPSLQTVTHVHVHIYNDVVKNLAVCL